MKEEEVLSENDVFDHYIFRAVIADSNVYVYLQASHANLASLQTIVWLYLKTKNVQFNQLCESISGSDIIYLYIYEIRY